MTTDNLYVVKRTVFNPKSPTEPTIDIALPATFTDLKAAKIKARTVLAEEGYEKEYFSIYDLNDDSKEWKYGDGVIVYAEGLAKEVLKVEIDTVPDTLGLQADSTGCVKAPLYHVLQTIIEYNNDRSGSQRYSIIEGTHTNPNIARKEALKVLLDNNVTKEDFVVYEEYLGHTEGPYGENVLVHAVKEGGCNLLVSVISDHKWKG